MINHLENAVEQGGDVMPAYVGENAPHFEHLEDIGHMATLDVMVANANYEDGIEDAEVKVVKETEMPVQASLFDERPHLLDPELDKVWQAQVAAAEKAAKEDVDRRKTGRGIIAQQNASAKEFDRRQAAELVPPVPPRRGRRVQSNAVRLEIERARRAIQKKRSEQMS